MTHSRGGADDRGRMAIAMLAAALSALVSLAAATCPAAAQRPEDFYKGRIVSVVVGSSTGGGYDLNARLLAEHIGQYIPGHPTLVVQNMPGAGGLRLAGYMSFAAPKDGSAFAILQRNLTVEPLFTKQSYNATKFTWLGSISNDVSLCVSSSTSKVKTFADLQIQPFTAASQSAGSDSYVFAALLKNLFGAKLKIVSGYPGTSDMALAMERGEVDGMCGISYSTLKSRFARLLQDKSINVLVQAGVDREPALSEVPSMAELAGSAQDRAIIRLLVGTQRMGRPFMAPPGIPDDRRDALRLAFDRTMTDADFISDAMKQEVDVSPMKGRAIDELLQDLYASPKEIVAKAAAAMAH
jgi:tripartite-type tricarboxylate transporter receptor subunit TctC